MSKNKIKIGDKALNARGGPQPTPVQDMNEQNGRMTGEQSPKILKRAIHLSVSDKPPEDLIWCAETWPSGHSISNQNQVLVLWWGSAGLVRPRSACRGRFHGIGDPRGPREVRGHGNLACPIPPPISNRRSSTWSLF